MFLRNAYRVSQHLLMRESMNGLKRIIGHNTHFVSLFYKSETMYNSLKKELWDLVVQIQDMSPCEAMKGFNP